MIRTPIEEQKKIDFRNKILSWAILPFLGICYSMAANILFSFFRTEGMSEQLAGPGFVLFQGNAFLSILFQLILAPVIEEWIFRGFLFKRLRNRFSFIVAGLLTSFVFAILHFSVAAFIYAFFLSLLLCEVYEAIGDFKASVFLHMSANFLSLFMTLWTMGNQYVMEHRLFFLACSATLLIILFFLFEIFTKRLKGIRFFTKQGK